MVYMWWDWEKFRIQHVWRASNQWRRHWCTKTMRTFPFFWWCLLLQLLHFCIIRSLWREFFVLKCPFDLHSTLCTCGTWNGIPLQSFFSVLFLLLSFAIWLSDSGECQQHWYYGIRIGFCYVSVFVAIETMRRQNCPHVVARQGCESILTATATFKSHAIQYQHIVTHMPNHHRWHMKC